MYQLKQVNKSDLNQDQLIAREAFKPGLSIYGFCCGYFGRDSYGEKVIVEVGPDYLVVRENGVTCQSFEINNWLELLNSSNNDAEELRYEKD